MQKGNKKEKVSNQSGEKVISFRLRKEDFETINQRIGELQLKTMSQYLRTLISEEDVKIKHVYYADSELLELLKELIFQTRMIGVNINQIAYWANSGQEIPDSFFSWAKSSIQTINRQYKNLLSEISKEIVVREKI